MDPSRQCHQCCSAFYKSSFGFQCDFYQELASSLNNCRTSPVKEHTLCIVLKAGNYTESTLLHRRCPMVILGLSSSVVFKGSFTLSCKIPCNLVHASHTTHSSHAAAHSSHTAHRRHRGFFFGKFSNDSFCSNK